MRSKFLGPAILQGKGSHMDVTTEDGDFWAILEAAIHRLSHRQSEGSEGTMHLGYKKSLEFHPFL